MGTCHGPVRTAGGFDVEPWPRADSVLPCRRSMRLTLLCIAAAGCAPANDLPGITGDAVRLVRTGPVDPGAELRTPLSGGQQPIRVLVFTRSDCPIANRYAPKIRELCTAYDPRDVELCLVYPDPRETADSMRAHQEEYDLPCRGLLDPAHRLVQAAGAKVTPEAVVYDRAGRAVYRGRIDNRFADYGRARAEPTSDDLRDAIDACLQGLPAPGAVTAAVGCLISDLR